MTSAVPPSVQELERERPSPTARQYRDAVTEMHRLLGVLKEPEPDVDQDHEALGSLLRTSGRTSLRTAWSGTRS
jgi:hypothetical protein